MANAACAWAQAPPEFQGIDVSPTPFSPNGDGIADVLNVGYQLTNDADWVTVFVKDHQDALVATLLDNVPQGAGGPHQLVWDGKDELSILAPDGEYTVYFTAGNSSGQAKPHERGVRLDATAPVAYITMISPNPFSPDLPQSPDSIEVRLSVSGSQPSDVLSVTVALMPASSADTLDLIPAFDGDGDYRAHWKDSGKGDGLYEVNASIMDGAGNRTVDMSTFYLDTSAPLIGMTYPEDEAIFTELPDSVYGLAYDPTGVQAIEISYDSRAFKPVAAIAGPDTVYWSAPLRDSLFGDGDHTLEARATDGLGHTGSGGDLGGPSSIAVTVDSEAPAGPILDPLPSMVRAAALRVSGRASGAKQAELYLNDLETPTATVSVTGTGTFSGTLELTPGPNQIAASATDLAGNRSPIGVPISVEFRREFGIFFNERFRPGDLIEISLDEPAREVTIALYSTAGRLIRVLRADGPSTSFQIAWDATDGDGDGANNGVYLCRVEATMQDGTVITDRKLVALVR